jgi:hypothetical protein
MSSPMVRLLATLLCWIVWSNTLFAQHKQTALKTGLYKTTEHSSFTYTDPVSGDTLYLDPVPVCPIGEFKKVAVSTDELTGEAVISIQLGEEGTAAFAKASRENINKKIAFIGNGKLLTAPVVREEIAGGRLQVTGGIPLEEANALVNRIRKDIPGYRSKTGEEEKQEGAIAEACGKLDKGLTEGDTAILKTLLHPKLSLGHSNGLIETKEELLQHLYSGYLKYKEIVEESYTEIQLVQDVATVRRNLKVSGALKDTSFDLRLKVLEVWIKRNGTWELLCRQSVKRQ